MNNVVDTTPAPAPVATEDLSDAIGRVLQESNEPLTIPKLRAMLPARYRNAWLEEILARQVAAKLLHPYPRYRSQYERYWDRPMTVHVASLLCTALKAGPLPAAELRRKLPAYAQGQADVVLAEQLAQGKLHRHPRTTSRGRDRVGVSPPRPHDYLQSELAALFGRLQTLGFTTPQLRQAAIELLHDQEWKPASTE